MWYSLCKNINNKITKLTLFLLYFKVWVFIITVLEKTIVLICNFCQNFQLLYNKVSQLVGFAKFQSKFRLIRNNTLFGIVFSKFEPGFQAFSNQLKSIEEKDNHGNNLLNLLLRSGNSVLTFFYPFF